MTTAEAIEVAKAAEPAPADHVPHDPKDPDPGLPPRRGRCMSSPI